MNLKTIKILNRCKIAVTLIYIFSALLLPIITQLASNHWKDFSLDGWFWLGALVLSLMTFPIFASIAVTLQAVGLKFKYGPPSTLQKIFRVIAYILSAASLLSALFILIILKAFDYWSYIPILLSAAAILIVLADSLYCFFTSRAKKTQPTY